MFLVEAHDATEGDGVRGGAGRADLGGGPTCDPTGEPG